MNQHPYQRRILEEEFLVIGFSCKDPLDFVRLFHFGERFFGLFPSVARVESGVGGVRGGPSSSLPLIETDPDKDFTLKVSLG